MCHFPIGILGQVWHLIVSIPDFNFESYSANVDILGRLHDNPRFSDNSLIKFILIINGSNYLLTNSNAELKVDPIGFVI